MKAHAQPGNFSCWFWNAIQAATGFTPEVVDEVKHSHHVSYEIPERRLDEVTWTDQAQLMNLKDHLGEHLTHLKELNQERQKTENSRAPPSDYLSRKKHQLVVDRVKATRPSLSFIYNFFEELNCQKCKIQTLDSSLTQFHQLKQISLTGNQIQVLKNLPDNLEIVNACGNQIAEVDDLSPNAQLRHIGLSFNKMASLCNIAPGNTMSFSHPRPDQSSTFPALPPEQIPSSPSTSPYLPALISLDVGFNDLCDLQSTLQDLGSLPNLIVAVLQGNPIALLPRYREAVICHLPKLQKLDDVDITAEEWEALQLLGADALDPTTPEFNEVSVEIAWLQIDGLTPDPDAQPKVLETENPAKGKKGKDAGKKKEEKKPPAKGGKGKKEDADMPQAPTITHQTCVYVECVFAGATVGTPVCPKQPRMAPPEGEEAAAEPEPIPPVTLGHVEALKLPPSVGLRDALMKPLTFHVWEVFRTITQEVNPDAPEDQQPEPEVVEERKRFGQCDLSFADVLLTKQSKVEVTCKMMPNEFIHIDHMRAEKVKAAEKEEEDKRKAEEERLQKEREAEELARQEEEEMAATMAATAKGAKKKPKPAPKAAGKKEEKKVEAEAAAEEAPKEVDRYVNPCDLEVWLKVALELNRPEPEKAEPTEEELALAGTMKSKASTPKKGGKKK